VNAELAESLVTRMSVLLAEDDPDLRRLVADVLRRDGHDVMEASDGTMLLFNLARTHLVNARWPEACLVISEIHMPLHDGLSVLRSLDEHGQRHPPFVFLTASSDDHACAEARRLGALAFIEKPFDVDELRALVREIASHHLGRAITSDSASAAP
jgi:DNA-binding response OmpR family regulator